MTRKISMYQFLKSISKRVSEISSNKRIFNQSIPYYENTLKKSEQNVSLNILQNKIKTKIINKGNKQRKRKIIWFNPPYSLNVKTNLGKLLLKLLDSHFPRAHKFHKIFNRDTVKISYCCMKKIGSIIFSLNKEVLQPRNENYGCNCRKKEICSLDNKCLTPNIIYESQITNNTNNEQKKYLGVAETSFMKRYSNHTGYFKYKKNMKCTELSKYIWSFKNQGITPITKWRIVKKVNCQVSPNYCKLCLRQLVGFEWLI